MNGYIAFYRGKKIYICANTSYEAQTMAVTTFRARKAYEVTVVLAERDGQQVTHSAGAL